MPDVEGYTATSYGDAFADVYDQWYPGVSDIAATVAVLERLARRSRARGARVLELGAGTGRLAIPLAQTGLAVTALDASAPMLARLRAADPDQRVETLQADMVDGLPPGPFDAVLVAYNTFFSGLLDPSRQRGCFAAVAARLAPKGSFVIEAFVPEDPPRSGDHVGIRSMTASAVVLSVSRHHPDHQQADGHFVELRDGEPVRLRPWAVRYATPAQLDEMAAGAGLSLQHRWEDVAGLPFGPQSPRHVSVYGRTG
jgi:SAM-dependent methyltransferase